MRMVRAENTIATDGAVETRQSTLGGDAKVVYAILTGMVTDKVAYAIREPGTNAWEANPKRPFELTLPSRFAPIIRFRDFGAGLSHHFMMHRYSKIGDSTKDDNDDAVGGWGFGSKSPLAYLMRQDGAGAFDVISRHKGMRRAYTIGINQQGKIQITFLGEEPMDDTDRGTGLEVSYPVRVEDIQRFHDYADRIFWGFNPAPIVLPPSEERPPLGRGTVKATGPGWTLYANDDYGKKVRTPWTGPHVRLGPVLYPVNLGLLDGLTGFVSSSDNILIEAQIGTLSVSASRETLSYDDMTKDTLSRLFQDYEMSFLKDIQTAIDQEPTYFDGCKVGYERCQTLGWDRAKPLFGRMLWRGQPVRDEMFEDLSPEASIRVRPFRGEFGFPTGFKATSIRPSTLAGCRIVVEHTPYRSMDRLAVAGLLTMADRTPVLWVRCRRHNLGHLHTVLGLSEGDYTVLDDIKLPPRKLDPNAPDSVKTKIRTRRQLTLNGESVTKPIDLLAGGLYVEVTGRGSNAHVNLAPDCDRQDWQRPYLNRLHELMKEAAELNLLDRDLPILIRKEGEVLEGEDWTSLGEYLAERIHERMDVSKLTPRTTWSRDSFDDQLIKLGRSFDLGLVPQAMLDCIHEMRTLLASKPEEDVLNEHDNLADLLTKFAKGATIPEAIDPSKAINSRWYKLMKQHPLLSFILNEMSVYGSYRGGSYDYKADKQQQATLDAYFKLYSRAA